MTAPPPRLLPFSAWPDIDRHSWETAVNEHRRAGMDVTAYPTIASGYGRWLSVLTTIGLLDRDLPPGDRVTPPAVKAFIAELHRCGNGKSTIEARLAHLGAALRIMAPETNFTWLHPRKLLTDQVKPTAPANKQWMDWPVWDQLLWEAGLKAGDILDHPNHASRLRPATLHSAVVGYRSWLVFLRANGLLDPDVKPAARVTRAHVAAYFKSLRDRQTNASVIARLTELRTALQIMEPEMDFRWLTSPGGRSLSAILPVKKRPVQIISSKVLYEWGISMTEDALHDLNPERRRIMVRNGVLIALFAARAPRVRSMASLRLGQTISRVGDTYLVVFEHEDIKTRRRLEYHTPSRLSAAIDRYIAVERAELLGTQKHDGLWVNEYGDRISTVDIANMIHRQSLREFGKSFGPHRFRHSLGTTAPLADPAHPGIAAAILGVSGHMVEQHYNRANQANVANTFHKNLSKIRIAHQSAALREFIEK